MPPAKLSSSKTVMAESFALMTPPALLTMPPANVPPDATRMPDPADVPDAEIVPLLVMPPEKSVTPKTSMPRLIRATIVPLLVMPPEKTQVVEDINSREIRPDDAAGVVDDAARKARVVLDPNAALTWRRYRAAIGYAAGKVGAAGNKDAVEPGLIAPLLLMPPEKAG